MTQHILYRALFVAFFIAFMMVSCQNENDSKQQPPTISSYAPGSANTGVAITINGNNFGTTRADVEVIFYDGAKAIVNSVTNTAISVTVPADGYMGTVSVKVKNKGVVGPVFKILKTCYVESIGGGIRCPRIKPS